MENKANFKSVPNKAFLIALIAVVSVVTLFALLTFRRSKPGIVIPEPQKEEVTTIGTKEKSITEEKPVSVLQKKFTIQVASFQEMTRAEKVSVGLKEKGYQPVISAKELPEKGTWYRVFVGDFDNEEAAKELLNTLKETYKDSFIKLR